MKIFILGIPHTQTIDPAKYSKYSYCPFTTKVWNLCRMMHERGHQVIHLGNGGSLPPCTEHVSVVSQSDFESVYGDHVNSQFFNLETTGKFAPHMAKHAASSQLAIKERVKNDWEAIICVPWGGMQLDAVKGINQFVVESGIGYPNPWTDTYRVYDSYAWMHYHLGKAGCLAGDKWYHVVIPNGFDTDLFGPVVPTEKKDNYLLTMCRLQDDKGIGIAVDVSRALGIPLKIVGPGNPQPYLGKGVTYQKPVGAEKRRELLRHARALFSATRYVEPFGMVAVEAMLSGCPVISTDWGAYSETVVQGVTGWRCRTRAAFLEAVKRSGEIDSQLCRDWAVKNYSLDRVGRMYEEYFQMVLDRNHDGWNKDDPEGNHLDWLKV